MFNYLKEVIFNNRITTIFMSAMVIIFLGLHLFGYSIFNTLETSKQKGNKSMGSSNHNYHK